MGTGLCVKDVEFNGAMLRAAEVENIIYVGVRWICQGLGFNEGKVKSERKKIQEDIVLSQGKKFLPLGNSNSDSETLCLMLDYLPLWLAKISITPTMRRETPEIAERLIEYQLKAKDVLAKAFLHKNETELATVNNNMIQIPIPKYPDYAEEFEILYTKMNDLEEQNVKLYNGMSNMAKLLLDMANKMETKELLEVAVDKPQIQLSDEELWKQSIYKKAENIVCGTNFRKTSMVLKYVYDYMNKNYGIVWEQEIRDYRQKNNLHSTPNTIDIVYDNESLRSIFTAILTDMEYKANKNAEKKEDVEWSDQKIDELVRKYHDRSRGHMVTYRRVYRKMDEDSNICWKNLETRYINEVGGKPSKKDLINSRKSLQPKFVKAIRELMEEN